MNRRIVGYRQDDEGQWVAELECGHSQHVRHDPPWQVRPWTTSPEGRAAHLGTPLRCRPCAERAYDDLRMQGLCHDGAVEAAFGSYSNWGRAVPSREYQVLPTPMSSESTRQVT